MFRLVYGISKLADIHILSKEDQKRPIEHLECPFMRSDQKRVTWFLVLGRVSVT